MFFKLYLKVLAIIGFHTNPLPSELKPQPSHEKQTMHEDYLKVIRNLNSADVLEVINETTFIPCEEFVGERLGLALKAESEDMATKIFPLIKKDACTSPEKLVKYCSNSKEPIVKGIGIGQTKPSLGRFDPLTIEFNSNKYYKENIDKDTLIKRILSFINKSKQLFLKYPKTDMYQFRAGYIIKKVSLGHITMLDQNKNILICPFNDDKHTANIQIKSDQKQTYIGRTLTNNNSNKNKLELDTKFFDECDSIIVSEEMKKNFNLPLIPSNKSVHILQSEEAVNKYNEDIAQGKKVLLLHSTC